MMHCDTHKRYPDIAPWDVEPFYSQHVGAMTCEGLHEKSDIAIQLALRDKRIAELETIQKETDEYGRELLARIAERDERIAELRERLERARAGASE